MIPRNNSREIPHSNTPSNDMGDILQEITVKFDYPICFTRNLFDPSNRVFVDTITRVEPEKKHQVLFVIDDNVAAAHTGLISSIRQYFDAYSSSLELVADPVLVQGGEEVKNDMAPLMNLVEQVNHHGIDRHSFMVIIGGGAVLDMACFAAAISHRGVRAVRIPTTVLSQDDSGVGVKNAINLFGKKNFIGTFIPPFAVLNDIDFISTLSHRDKIAGVAEAVKVALIRDAVFFDYLERNAERIAAADMEVMAHLIRRSAELHMNHIANSGDPYELGSARPLDFGHWTAHKMESLTRNRLRHGEAVALGMALDTVYSVKAGHISQADGERVISLLTAVGLNLWDDVLLAEDESGRPAVLEGLREFREHLGGILHITLLRDIGDGFEVTEMDVGRILESIQWLRERFAPLASPDSRRVSNVSSA